MQVSVTMKREDNPLIVYLLKVHADTYRVNKVIHVYKVEPRKVKKL